MKILLPSVLLLALSLRATAAEEASPFLQVVAGQFARWDTNHDGVLSSNELDAAIADSGTTNQNAAALAALKRASRRAKTAKPLPSLTLENIRALTAERDPDFSRMFREGLDRINTATNRALFADGLPRLETIHQGKLGNCFCLAPLGAMVHRDPRQVAGMFSAQTNGDYCVKLGSQSVQITPPTDAEIAMTSSNERQGIWVNIYEKAVGQARNDQRPPGERLDSPLDALARGGSAGTMLAFITGHEITRFSFKFAKNDSVAGTEFTNKLEDLRGQLSAATMQNRLMTCGTLKTTTPGLTPNHAYAVFRYDTNTDSVELWNPHGQSSKIRGTPGLANGYPTTNGVFWIPTPEFVRQFSGMAFEVAARAPARD
jgi:hypothetical protein